MLLPAQYALFDEHLPYRRVQDALAGYLNQLTGVVGRPASQATQSEGGAYQQREAAQFVDGGEDLLDRVAGDRLAHRQVDLLADLLEQVAVLGLVDRGEVATDELDAQFVERAVVG